MLNLLRIYLICMDLYSRKINFVSLLLFFVGFKIITFLPFCSRGHSSFHHIKIPNFRYQLLRILSFILSNVVNRFGIFCFLLCYILSLWERLLMFSFSSYLLVTNVTAFCSIFSIYYQVWVMKLFKGHLYIFYSKMTVRGMKQVKTMGTLFHITNKW